VGAHLQKGMSEAPKKLRIFSSIDEPFTKGINAVPKQTNEMKLYRLPPLDTLPDNQRDALTIQQLSYEGKEGAAIALTRYWKDVVFCSDTGPKKRIYAYNATKNCGLGHHLWMSTMLWWTYLVQRQYGTGMVILSISQHMRW
jgi:hypothetical protein